MLNAMTWAIKLMACLVGLIVWSTVGTLISIAKIVRVVAAFSVKVTLQAFKDQDMRPAEKSIQTALAFWPDGIKRILKILSTESTFEREEIMPWSKILPSFVRDIVYMIFLCIPIFTYYWLTTNSASDVATLPSQLFSSITTAVARTTTSEDTQVGVAASQPNSAPPAAPAPGARHPAAD